MDSVKVSSAYSLTCSQPNSKTTLPLLFRTKSLMFGAAGGGHGVSKDRFLPLKEAMVLSCFIVFGTSVTCRVI